jgi:hypothetical protein
MRRRTLLLILVLAAAESAALAGGPAPRPRLDLRPTPRVALSPVSVFVMAELVGGDDLEDFHCPGLEWDWDDGTRSAHEADCEPFGPGTVVDRRFAAHHVYRDPGEYNIRLSLRRAGRLVSAGSARVLVHSAGSY